MNMSDRQLLNNRRSNTTFDFEIKGLKYTATVGYYPNGHIGELSPIQQHQTLTRATWRLHFRLPSSTAPRLKTSAARSVAIHTVAPPVRSEPRLISCWGMNHEHRRAATAVKKSAAPDAAGGATVD